MDLCGPYKQGLQPFEDVSPIYNGDFPASHVSFSRVIIGIPYKVGPYQI